MQLCLWCLMLLRASTLACGSALLVGALLLASLRRRRRTSGRPVLAPRCAAVEAGAAPLIVVVGLGGVGSHAAQLLLRGGVVRLRLVDFDQVTLSSLNRHATATRADVGLAKALALRAALLAIRPGAEIDARVSLFNAAAAAELLGGPVALVIDAIDDIATKAELQVHCFRAGLPLLSALGAGGKADCGCLHVAPLADVLGDPVASSVGKLVRAAEPAGGDWWRSLDQRVECVYSSEKQRVGCACRGSMRGGGSRGVLTPRARWTCSGCCRCRRAPARSRSARSQPSARESCPSSRRCPPPSGPPSPRAHSSCCAEAEVEEAAEEAEEEAEAATLPM